ncbi:hypothetical protein [Streptomyces sp. NPDC041003]
MRKSQLIEVIKEAQAGMVI